MAKCTLYVCRPLLNGNALHAWAASQGFKTALPDDDLHVTIAFSRDKLDWPETRAGKLNVSGGSRSIEKFGDAIVLRFSSAKLKSRWRSICDAGASWDHPGYKPHITITYNAKGVDLDKVKPYSGPLSFGSEKFAEVKEDAADDITETKLKVLRAAKRGLISDTQLAKLNARAA